jgi:predicted SprT family Zn-dependent metalloprotease
MSTTEWAREEALRLMKQFGLSDWQFAFNRRKRVLGLCFYPDGVNPGRIELSVYAVDLNDEAAIRDTLLHEIAHALAGEMGEYGHGRVWKEKARKLGARPTACSAEKRMPGNWQARCNGCGRVHTRFRKPKVLEHFCLACGLEKGRLTFAPVVRPRL